MIKFFRHIRQTLMMENKTSKPSLPVGRYLKYAIGEIILVVIGILIALQINNWNENRKLELAESDFLKGIKNDLKQDKDYIQLIFENIDPKIKAFTILNEQILNSKDGQISLNDSLFHTYLFTGQRTFYPVSGSFQSAVAGNNINTFNNKEIKSAIIKLYNSIYPRLEDNAQMLDHRWSGLTEKYLDERRTKHLVIKDKAQATKVINDMYYHFLQLRWYRNLLEQTNVEINLILKQIDD